MKVITAISWLGVIEKYQQQLDGTIIEVLRLYYQKRINELLSQHTAL